jgi:hypothetical protein
MGYWESLFAVASVAARFFEWIRIIDIGCIGTTVGGRDGAAGGVGDGAGGGRGGVVDGGSPGGGRCS